MLRAEAVEVEPDAWCDWCGDALPEPEERTSRQRFCDRKCMQAYHNDVRRERRQARPSRECRQCGAPFVATRSDRMVCSPKCGEKWQNAQRPPRPSPKRPRPVRACRHCGAEFVATRADKLHCTKLCATKTWRRRER